MKVPELHPQKQIHLQFVKSHVDHETLSPMLLLEVPLSSPAGTTMSTW